MVSRLTLRFTYPLMVLGLWQSKPQTDDSKPSDIEVRDVWRLFYAPSRLNTQVNGQMYLLHLLVSETKE